MRVCGFPGCQTIVNPMSLPPPQQCVSLTGMDGFASVCRKCFLRNTFRHVPEPDRTLAVERVLEEEKRSRSEASKRDGHGPEVLSFVPG